MQSILETYLHQIESHLKGLSAHEKEQQLQEISQHLEILIAGQQVAGLSEAEAMQAAIRKFGDPAEIGRDIIEAIVGQKTGLLKGLLLGAMTGAAVLAAPEFMALCLTGGLIQTGREGFQWAVYGPIVLNAIY
ncbi:hypothetical protein EON80_03865, partial [bacterium]